MKHCDSKVERINSNFEPRRILVCNLVANKKNLKHSCHRNRLTGVHAMTKGSKPRRLTLEAAKSVLRGVGMRCTTARIAVIQSLDAAESPMTPAGFVDSLCEYGFDKSTIYRSLTELNESGVVVRLDLGDAVRRFELLPLKNDGASGHPHFMCVDCGKVVCMSGFDVELKGRSRKAREPGIMCEILVRGHCHEYAI